MFWASASLKSSKDFLTQREKLITVSLLTKMTKSLSFKKTSLALAVALSLPVISAQAAESYKAQDVVVTASRVEQQLADVNMSVSVITSEEIEKNSGAKTIADLLEGVVPGIRVNNDGGQGIDRIKIRGEDSFRTVVMIDGQRITEHKSMSGVPLLIDPSQVERIEVIRGPASVLYGSDAIGGVINIITKKGGTEPIQGQVSAGYDTSSDGKNASASIYGAAAGWKYRIGVAGSKNDNLDTPKGEMPNTESETKSANLFLSYDIDPNKTIGLSLDHYDLSFMSGALQYGEEDFFVDVPEWKRTKFGIFGEFKNINDTLVRLRTDAYYQKNTKKMQNHVAAHGGSFTRNGTTYINADTVVDNFANNDTDTVNFSTQADWQLSDNNYLITGYEFSQDKLDAKSDADVNVSGTNSEVPTMSVHINPITNKQYNGKQQQHSVFASMETTLWEDYVFNYGVRYTWIKGDMTSKEGGLTTVIPMVNGTPVTTQQIASETKKFKNDSSDGKAVFNFGVTYHGFENLALRANWAQGYRHPILQELYIDTSMGSTDGITRANPDLKPETSDNFEIGLRYDNQRFMFDGAIFYSDADDYITTVPVAGSEDSQYSNMGKAKTLGLELSSSLKLGEFEPYTVLTLLNRKYEENGMTSRKTGTPKVSARYGVRYNSEFKGADIRLDAYAVSQSATESDNLDTSINEETGQSNRAVTSFGGSTTFNLTGGISFGPQKAYSLDAGFYNITDKAYKTSDAIYEAGRHFAVKLNAKF